MRNPSKAILILLITSFFVQAGMAQKNVVKKQPTPAKIFKAPKLHSYLGIYKDSVSISADLAENNIAAPLKIYDDNKVEYQISSYQFLYKKITVTENEENGKISASSSIASARFVVTPLPDLWVNQIREQVKSGEELYFFDIIAKDAHGRVMYASDLKIKVQ